VFSVRRSVSQRIVSSDSFVYFSSHYYFGNVELSVRIVLFELKIPHQHLAWYRTLP
jgi:hypothetical protein